MAARVWPQDRAADVHDLLEARYHLLQAGDTEDAGQVTERACDQLDTWGAWDQEASLIYDTLARLPADSPRRAAWIHHAEEVCHLVSGHTVRHVLKTYDKPVEQMFIDYLRKREQQ